MSSQTLQTEASLFPRWNLLNSGRLVRMPSGGERARFLEEESEPRNKLIFLAGGNQRAEEPACLLSSTESVHMTAEG
jgi:hypothetical protein